MSEGSALPPPRRWLTWIGRALLPLLLAVLAAAVWWLGPMIALGEARPLEGVLPRAICIALGVLAALGLGLWPSFTRHADTAVRRRPGAVETAVKVGVARLREVTRPRLGSGLPASWRRWTWSLDQRHLHALPWTLVLEHKGADAASALALAGIGGPAAAREGAFLMSIEAGQMLAFAGAGSAPASDGYIDVGYWNEMLAAFRQERPLQPLNAIVVVIAAAALRGGEAAVDVLAAALAGRLQGLVAVLECHPTLHLVLTGASPQDKEASPDRMERLLRPSLLPLDGMCLLAAGDAGFADYLQAEVRASVVRAVPNTRWLQRRRLRFAAAACLVAGSYLALWVGWGVSLQRNLAYADRVAARLPRLRVTLSALPAGGGKAPAALSAAGSDEISSLSAALSEVRDASKGDGHGLAQPPLLNGLGLYQGSKLGAATGEAYRRLLREQLQPRIVRNIEERLRSAVSGGGEAGNLIYPSLKAYLMLGKPEHFEAQFVQWWVRADWRQRHSDLPQSAQQDLEAHLDVLLADIPFQVPTAWDAALVDLARARLDAQPVAQRIYDGVKSDTRTENELAVTDLAGPGAAEIFERASGLPLSRGVPGLYTFEFYRKRLRPALPFEAWTKVHEQAWVMGTTNSAQPMLTKASEQAILEEVRRRYLDDYIAAWDGLLADLRLRPLDSLDRAIAVSSLLAAPDSPLAVLVQGVAEQTKLARRIELDMKTMAVRSQDDASASVTAAEQRVDDHFAALHRLVGGKPSPLDETLHLFSEIHLTLRAVDAALKSGASPPLDTGVALVKAEAARLPAPLRGLFSSLAGSVDSVTATASAAALKGTLAPLAATCRAMTANRYPFTADARLDVLPDDFRQLFGIDGLFDTYFQRELSSRVDMSVTPWRFKASAGAPTLTADTLLQFQRAAAIRDAFFRGDGNEPGLKLEMKAVEFDAGLAEVAVDIDGQVQKLAVGSAAIKLTWPGARSSSQIRLTVAPAQPIATSFFEGPWAVFRMIDRFEVKPSAAPQRASVVMNFDGRLARVELISSTVRNPLRLRELREFRCPGSP